MQQKRRYQKNITLTKEQVDYINENFGKISLIQMARNLGVDYNKVHCNARLLGKVNPLGIREFNFNKNGYFDIGKFKKYYEY